MNLLAQTVIFASVSMVFYSLIDIIAKTRVKKEDANSVAFTAFAVSAVFSLICIVIFEPGIPANLASITTQAAILISAAFLAYGCNVYYNGMRNGRVSVLSPIAGIQGPIAAVLAVVFFGESVSATLVSAIILAGLGTFLVGFGNASMKNFHKIFNSVELRDGLVSSVAFGINLFLTAVVVKSIGIFWEILAVDIFALIFLMAFFQYRFSLPRGAFPWGGMGIAVSEWLGDASYNAAIATGLTSLAAPIASASPAISVAIGIFWLKEKIKPVQMAGILLVIVALVIASAY